MEIICAELWRFNSMCLASCMMVLVLVMPGVAGNALLLEPPARNVLAYGKTEYGPQLLNAGGPTAVRDRGGNVWPSNNVPKSHGLCGDPRLGKEAQANWRDETYLKPTPVQRTYTAGDVVEFSVGISTHHAGHFEFRICDKALDGATLESREAGQQCLDAHVLHRAPLKDSCVGTDLEDSDCQPIDENFPGRWYLPPRGKGTPNTDSTLPMLTEVHKMRYKIPNDLKCERCTLQWYWSTGNICLYDAGYFSYFKKMAKVGYPASSWCYYCSLPKCSKSCCGTQGNGKYPEEFWNCADVAVAQQPAPAPPPPTPVSSACKAYCNKTNVAQTASKRCHKITAQDTCLGSYMHKTTFNKGKVTPCMWSRKKNRCRPRKKQGINCPGFRGSCSAELLEMGSSSMVTATATAADEGFPKLPVMPEASSPGFLRPRFHSGRLTLSSWFLQNQSRFKERGFHDEMEVLSEEL